MQLVRTLHIESIYIVFCASLILYRNTLATHRALFLDSRSYPYYLGTSITPNRYWGLKNLWSFLCRSGLIIPKLQLGVQANFQTTCEKSLYRESLITFELNLIEN